jgi:hypothetical protein
VNALVGQPRHVSDGDLTPGSIPGTPQLGGVGGALGLMGTPTRMGNGRLSRQSDVGSGISGTGRMSPGTTLAGTMSGTDNLLDRFVSAVRRLSTPDDVLTDKH